MSLPCCPNGRVRLSPQPPRPIAGDSHKPPRPIAGDSHKPPRQPRQARRPGACYGWMMDGIDHAMTAAAENMLSALPPGGRQHACYPFTGPARSQWSYLPGSRRGIALSELGTTGRKAAHRLLATALSRATFAQAVTIMAFEEVLDLDEQGQLGRHSSGYHVAIFGSPG